MDVTADDFRQGMRRLGGAVSIVTAANGEAWAGLTATAVTSLSAEPPRLLACVNQQGATYDTLSKGRKMAINVLGVKHKALAMRLPAWTVSLRTSGLMVEVGSLLLMVRLYCLARWSVSFVMLKASRMPAAMALSLAMLSKLSPLKLVALTHYATLMATGPSWRGWHNPNRKLTKNSVFQSKRKSLHKKVQIFLGWPNRNMLTLRIISIRYLVFFA